MLLLSLFVYSDLKKKENFLQKLLQTSAPCPQCLRSWIVIYIHIYEGVHLTLSPDIFFRRRKVWNMLHQGSVGASSEQNKRNLTLILNLLLASIVFHNTICVFIIIFTALSFFMAYSKLIFYMGGRGVMSVWLYDILVYWYIIIYTYLNLSTSICAKNIDCLVSYWGFCPNFVFKIMKKNTLLHFLVLIWCVCVFVCVCLCLRPSTVKALSLWISWDTREQINDVMLKTFISYAESYNEPLYRVCTLEASKPTT